MDRIYLEFHNEVENKHRFYQLLIMPGLFGDWSLVREWGHVGSPGTVKKDWFASESEADAAREKIRLSKLKKGYFLRR
ncbi:MAG: WGR domain-containing protein [Methyloprofundus sp.]|nr:WGR domain-containing protein [Methyloprofundus sp.]